MSYHKTTSKRLWGHSLGTIRASLFEVGGSLILVGSWSAREANPWQHS